MTFPNEIEYAKHLLEGHNCDNCWWNNNHIKPVSMFCLRNQDTPYWPDDKDFGKQLKKYNICDSYINENELSKEQILKINRLQTEYKHRLINQSFVNKIIDIMEKI